MPRTAFGSFTGNGTSGPESPVSLTFSFPPQLLAVRRSGSSCRPLRPAPPPGRHPGGGLGHIDFYVNVTWSGNQVSWYTSKDNPSTQMNSEGVEYFYFAIAVIRHADPCALCKGSAGLNEMTLTELQSW